MSLYIHPENQTLLWNTLQKNPKFHNLTINKQEWFSNIIKAFYENIQYLPPLTSQDLLQINRQTITYMMEEINTLLNDRPKFTESKKVVSDFNMRQQEYEASLKPKVPPIADFSEKINDDAIQNMDELLQQQIRQRDYDVEQAKERLPPPPPAVTQSPTPLQSNSMIDSVFKETVDARMSKIEQTLEKLYQKMEKLLDTFSESRPVEPAEPAEPFTTPLDADSAPENK
jgi:hypothetical protein